MTNPPRTAGAVSSDPQAGTVIVVGGASGIGAACARRLGRTGHRVHVVDLDEDGAARVAAQVPGATSGGMDVRDPEQVRAAVSQCGRIHGMVVSAGILGPVGGLTTCAPSDWDAVLATNLTGTFHLLQAALPPMMSVRAGSIVVVASILGTIGMAGVAPYVAAKHGVIGLVRAAALEAAGYSVRVNAVAPSFVDTPLLTAGFGEDAAESFIDEHPLRRLATVEDVAAMVTFLISQESTFLTGGVYPVDGGYLAQ